VVKIHPGEPKFNNEVGRQWVILLRLIPITTLFTSFYLFNYSFIEERIMTTKYTQHFNTVQTPQTQPIPGKNMVQNNAGGYTFALDAFGQMERFLILGSEGGTYYVSEQQLTQQNAANTIKAIQTDGPRAVQLIVDISTAGRAYRNDAAIFALALATTFGDANTKKLAYDAISKVCRTGTHLFSFCESINNLRGWSAGLRKGVAKYYTQKSDNALAMQLIKYRQRNGWTHRDVLRLSHPTVDGMKHELLKWTVDNAKKQPNQLHPIVEAFLKVQDPKVSVTEKLNLIQTYNLPWEALPTDMLSNKTVWETLLPSMGMIATIRNLGKMTSIGMFSSNLGSDTKTLLSKFTEDEIKTSKVHPFQVLLGMKTYGQGHGFKGSLSWAPNQKVMDTLNDTFYKAFKNVTPSGKNFFFGIDVSGSMSSPIMNSALMCSEAAAAMALVTMNVEQNVDAYGFQTGLTDLKISPKQRLDDVVRRTSGLTFGGTDCSLPMVFAAKQNLKVDQFVVLTDNETYAGQIQPVQALQQYRQKMGIPAKLVVVAMAATPFTIADPNDSGMLDVVGFDANTPSVISDFAAK
jgi:60 kDa SS-A/Ro ribonucleoprotein